MSRQCYRLTDETRQVLTNRCPEIAVEMDVSDKYLYGMLAESVTDSFAPFLRMFRGAANACAPVEIWLDPLIAIAKRAKKSCAEAAESLSAMLLDKIRTDAATTERLVAVLDDGELDRRECHELLAAADKMDAVAARIRAAAHQRLGEIVDAPSGLRAIS